MKLSVPVSASVPGAGLGGGEGGGRFDSECQLLSGLVSMRVLEHVVDRAQERAGGGLNPEARRRLKDLWMDKLFQRGGLSLEAAAKIGRRGVGVGGVGGVGGGAGAGAGAGAGLGGAEQAADDEAEAIRKRSKYLNAVSLALPALGSVQGCVGVPVPVMSLPAVTFAGHKARDATMHVQSGYSLSTTVVGAAPVPQNEHVFDIPIKDKRSALGGPTPLGAAAAAAAFAGEAECDAQWANALCYPFLGLLVNFKKRTAVGDDDEGNPEWSTGRVIQLIFHPQHGGLQAVCVREANGEETEVFWPSKSIRCVVEPTLPAGEAAAEVSGKGGIRQRVSPARRRAADDLDQDGDEEGDEDDGGEDVDEEEDDELADRLGVAGLGVDLQALARSCSGSGPTSLVTLTSQRPQDMQVPLLTLPLPVPGQREALAARLQEAEDYFENGGVSLRVRTRPVLPDGTPIALRPLAAAAVAADADIDVDQVELDACDDPTLPLPEPSCTVYGVVDGAGLRRRKRLWSGVLRDAYVVVGGVSSVLPQCQIRLDPTVIVDPSLPLPRNLR